MEACAFRDAFPRFEGIDAVILGASPDSVGAQAKFKAKYDLPFALIADKEHTLAETYGVWVPKVMYGKMFNGVERSTFLIDAEGRLTHIFRKVKVDGHVEEVMAALR